MRFRGRPSDLDGLSERDRARIRAAGAASVVPGLEGLAGTGAPPQPPAPAGPIRSTDPLPGKPVAQPIPPKGTPRKGKRA